MLRICMSVTLRNVSSFLLQVIDGTKTKSNLFVSLGMHRIAICIILQEPEPEPDIWILVAQQLIFVFTVCYE